MDSARAQHMKAFSLSTDAQSMAYAGITNTLSAEAIATTATASAAQPSGPADSKTLP